MGLLAQKGMLFVLMFLVGSSCAWGQECGYRMARIDYFCMRPAEKDPPVPLWEEGERVPAVVRDLLNDPSVETARRYLDWQRRRLERINLAQTFVESVVSTESGR